MKVILLGDSVIDNAVYVQPGEPDVPAQLAAKFGEAHRVTSLAVDGAMMMDVLLQAKQVPVGTTHLVVSAGGNDLLDNLLLMQTPVETVGEGLLELYAVARAFAENHQILLDALLKRDLPLIVCTIYNPMEPSQPERTIYEIAVRFFDDIIVQNAASWGLPVLDLRRVCTDPGDYANPIEPSAAGGEKIARHLAHILRTHDFEMRQTIVYP